MGLSGLSADLRTKTLLLQFQVGARAWAAGQVPGWECARGNRLKYLSDIHVSLPLSLPSFPRSLKINKIFKTRIKVQFFSSEHVLKERVLFI